MRTARLPLFLVMLACVHCDAEENGVVTIAGADSDGPGRVNGTDSPSDTDGVDPECRNPLVRVDPDDGSETVSLGAPIRALFATKEQGATLRLRTNDRDVQGRTVVEDDGAAVRFEPLAPIRADTPYELTVQWSCGTHTAAWRTDAATYQLVPAAASLTVPDTELGIAAVLSPMLMRLDAIGGGSAQMLVGPAEGFKQDPCSATSLLIGDIDGDGHFDVDTPSLTLRAGSARTQARTVRALGTFDVEQGTLTAISMTASIDLRPLVRSLVGANATLQDVCDELPAGCARCIDGVLGCVDVRMEAFGVSASAAEVTPITAAEVSANADCSQP